MEQLIEVISIAGYPVLFVLGCVIGYWEKCIQLRVAERRERLRLATTNTIKSANGVEYIKTADRTYYLKETIAEAE